MVEPQAPWEATPGRSGEANAPAQSSGAPAPSSEVSKRVDETEARDKAAVAAVQEIAKWITGGVAVAAGGIIAGASLTSIGSLGWESRLAFAVSAAIVGFAALGYILWTAIDVLLPRKYGLNSILRGETVGKRDQKVVFERVRAHLPPSAPALEELAKDFSQAYVALTDAVARGEQVAPRERERLRKAASYIQMVESNMTFEHSRYLFEGLRRRIFIVSPIVALAFGAFAWAANPGKDNARDVTPVVKEATVSQADGQVFASLIGSRDCIEARLKAIAYREWRSGVQDVLTIPTEKCRVIRLRLDHGLLTPPG